MRRIFFLQLQRRDGHDASIMQNCWSVLSLSGTSSFWLGVGSGHLDFTKGMDSLDKHVKQISFRQCIAFREHGQLKGCQPHFQPTDAKIVIGLQQSDITCHNREHNQYPVTQTLDTITVLYVTNLGEHNSLTKPSASLHETGACFCSCNEGMGMMQAYPSQEPQSSGWEWMLGNSKTEWWEWILKQTCRHMVRTSVAEMLTAPFPTRRG